MHSRKPRHKNRNVRGGNSGNNINEHLQEELVTHFSSGFVNVHMKHTNNGNDKQQFRPKQTSTASKRRGLANWITVNIDNKEYTAIFVSAACRSLIKTSMVTAYKHINEKPALNTIGNNRIDTKGIVNVPLHIGKHFKVHYKFVMVDDIPNVDMVLGIDFMCRFNVSLDFASNIVTLRDKNVCSVELHQDIKDDDDISIPHTTYLYCVFPASEASYQQAANDLQYGHSSADSHCSDLPILADEKEKPPINSTYPLSARKQLLLQKEIKRLLIEGVIRPSTSWYCSPVDIIEKQYGPLEDTEMVIAVDYRNVNQFFKADCVPLPNIGTITSQLAGASYFSVLQLRNAFHQIPLKEEDKMKTAFSTPTGHYEYNVLPCGLRISIPTLQRRMHNILNKLIGKICEVYLGTILVYSCNYDTHMSHLRTVLDRLRKAGLIIDAKQCIFCFKELTYLGFVLCEDGWKIAPAKITAICDYAAPRNKRNMRKFIRSVSIYRKLVPKFAEIIKPLQDLTKRGLRFRWTSKCQKALDDVKASFKSSPVLWYPDFHLPFKLLTHANRVSINAVLFQEMNNVPVPVCFGSRLLKSIEICHYSDIELQVLAVAWGVRHFRSYLADSQFTVYTDKYIFDDISAYPSTCISQWLLDLYDYDYSIMDHSDVESIIHLDVSKYII